MFRTVETRAALFGTALLATDASYLLTVRWDWGPVALQHLCLIGGVLAIVRFWQENSLQLARRRLFRIRSGAVGQGALQLVDRGAWRRDPHGFSPLRTRVTEAAPRRDRHNSLSARRSSATYLQRTTRLDYLSHQRPVVERDAEIQSWTCLGHS